jgi:hypothetical protein
MKKVEVATPISRDDPEKVKIEEIPLPPEEMWAELDNSGKGSPPAAKPEPGAAPADRPVEKLEFLDAVNLVIPLKFPFRWQGKKVDAITVRRLTVGELGDLIDSIPEPRPDNFDIYAAMTGLPAKVLRGLIDQDGEQVTEACYDFLPRLFRPRTDPPSASSST